MIEYLTNRLASWPQAISAAPLRAVMTFALVVLFVDLARRGWRMSWSRRSINSTLATIGIFHFNFLMVPIVWLAAESFRTFYASLGIPQLPPEIWTHVPWLGMLLIGILVYDFADYCIHRLLHLRWLWPIHAVHHSDPDVNSLSADRIHFLEALLMWINYIVMLTWLGLPDNVLASGAVFLALHKAYIHTNLDWDHGPFRFLLASPRFHRWHHADVPEAYGKNLANFFPLYDRMFGTYYDGGPCHAPLGAPGVPQNDVAKLILFPVQEWSRMIGEKLSGLAGARNAAERGK